MRTELPATAWAFDWNVMPTSGTARYWQLTWALLEEQHARLADEGIVARDRFGRQGTLWTPAVDLALSEPTTFAWMDAEAFVPAREVDAVASRGCPARLLPGDTLRLEACLLDRYHEGMGANYWSTEDPALGVRFIHSAREGRWGGAALLADALIVPLGHPIVGDGRRANGLVRDLQEITEVFRARHGLRPSGVY